MFAPSTTHAQDPAHDHVGAIYHAVTLETGYGDQGAVWDADGWVGGDTHKLWLKSEGEVRDGDTEGEVWGLYSRNVATFWDAQIGVRQDFGHSEHTYLVAGVNGLAPYFFETEAHLFIRDDGAVSAWLRQENELLLTNRLIAEPSIEVHLNGEDDVQQGLGTGLTHAEAALQVRYEITRRFAPYVEWGYERQFGGTADLSRARGKDDEETRITAGIRWLF